MFFLTKLTTFLALVQKYSCVRQKIEQNNIYIKNRDVYSEWQKNSQNICF